MCLLGTLGIAQRHRDGLSAGPHRGHLHAALDLDALSRELLSQEPLGLRLREHQDEVESAWHPVQFDRRQLLVAGVQAGGASPVAEREHLVTDAADAQQFHRAGLHGQRTRLGGGPHGAIHDADVDAQA